MPRPGRRALAALLLAGASIAAPLVTSAPASAAPVQIQLLTINDFHGRLQPDATAAVPGVAKLATLVETTSASLPTGFVSAGDNIGASPFVSAADQDFPTLDVLDAMGLDATAVGNHEFDKGFADLTDRVIPDVDFPHLGANVYVTATGERALDAYDIQDVGGVDVAYVGVVTQETPALVTPDGIAGLEFRDPVAEAEDVAAELKDGNAANGEADVVVLLTHEGANMSSIATPEALAADPVFGDFVAMSADVDVIFSGHTHQPYAFEIAIPGTQRTRPVIQAQEYGKKLGQTTLTVDPATGSVEVDAVALLDPMASAADPEVATLVQTAVDASAALGAPTIGKIDADILRGGATPGSDRGVESDLGNFIADALLSGTSASNRGGAELAFMNPGGMRADFLVASNPDTPGDAVGTVTYGEAFAVQSFANDVITKTYTGAQIKQALEQQWQPDGASRPVLWLGVSEGFTYTYDPAAPRGSHITPGSMRLDGVRIDPTDTVRVTVNSFLAAGGDNFAALGGGTDRSFTGDNDLAVLRTYFESFLPGVVEIDREPRSTFPVTPGTPDVVPFASPTAAVDEVFASVAGRTPSAAERTAWIDGITNGSRTVVQLILEAQTVETRDPAAQVTRIYLGLFDRGPDSDGLAYWVDQIADGRSINSVAAFFARSAEFQELYGDTTDEEFVDLVYLNVLEREADAEGRAFWLGELGRGVPRHRMFLLFSESAEFRTSSLTALRIIDLHLSMLGRTPSPAELNSLVADVEAGELTISDIIDSIRFSDEYEEHITPDA